MLMGTALGCSIAILAAPALAADECGAITRNVGSPDTVTCTSAGNTYPSGISYNQQDAPPLAPPPNDLTVTLNSGVVVNSSGNGVLVVNTSGAGHSAAIYNNNGGTVTAVATGLYAFASGPGLAKIVNTGSIGAGDIGLHGYNAGTGGVSLTNAGAISISGVGDNATYSTGILAGYTAGAATVVNSGAITITTAKPVAVGIGTDSIGAASVTNNVGGAIVINGAGAVTGIQAGFQGPTVASTTLVKNYADITVATTGATSTATGIAAQSVSGTTVTATSGAIQASGFNAFGVNASASAGDVTVTTTGNTVTITNASTGSPASEAIYAHAVGGVAQVFAGKTYASGLGAAGIYAKGDNGAYVNAGTKVSTTGFGVKAVSSGKYADVIAGSVTTTGAGATGITATASNGSVSVASTSVSTAGANADGILATGGGDVTVTSGTVGTTGAGATGIYAHSTGGNVVVTSTGVTTSAAIGISAVSTTGSATVTATNVTVAGDNVTGVNALGETNATVVSTGTITATGPAGAYTIGVHAKADNGAATVTVNNVSGTQFGVLAVGYSGSATATINVNGAVSATGSSVIIPPSAGVFAASQGVATVNIAHLASVTSAGKYSVAESSGVGAIVNNHGTISGGSNDTVSIFTSSTGPGITVNNFSDGVITGNVALESVFATVFNNAGVWNALATSFLGNTQAGYVEGVVNNTGTVNVAPGATTPTTVTVGDLATWNNAGGSIVITNGHTGDVFDLGTAAFNGGTGSRLLVDANLSGPLSTNELKIGAAGGVTTVTVTDLTPTKPGAFDFVGATVVQGTSGTQGNFVLAGEPIHKGLVDYALYFNPSAVTWNLVGLPDHAAFETEKLPALSQAFAEKSTDVWFNRTREVRDSVAEGARKEGFEVWGQVYGGSEDLDQTQGFSFGPFGFNENLSTRNQWAGVQVGVDHLAAWKSGTLLWGFTGGYLEQDTRFANASNVVSWAGGGYTEPNLAADKFKLTGANIGGYLGYSRGGFFTNALLKVDIANVSVSFDSVPAQTSTNATIWSGSGEAGYRWTRRNWFLEPLVRLTGSSTDIDNWGMAGATITARADPNLSGAAGARLGATLIGSGSYQITPYVGVYALDPLTGQNRTTVSTGGTAIDLTDQTGKTTGRVDVGFTAKTVFGLEGFAKVTADFGSGVSGWNGDLGVRWRW
jgi:outer membrane autotransporter protein